MRLHIDGRSVEELVNLVSNRKIPQPHQAICYVILLFDHDRLLLDSTQGINQSYVDLEVYGLFFLSFFSEELILA